MSYYEPPDSPDTNDACPHPDRTRVSWCDSTGWVDEFAEDSSRDTWFEVWIDECDECARQQIETVSYVRLEVKEGMQQSWT